MTPEHRSDVGERRTGGVDRQLRISVPIAFQRLAVRALVYSARVLYIVGVRRSGPDVVPLIIRSRAWLFSSLAVR